MSLSLPRLCQAPVPGLRRFSLPRLRQPQSRPVGWCVVGGKRRVPLPPQIVSASPGLASPGLFPQIVSAPVLAGVWWR